ncbi:ABC transporter ATP-binding protein [Saccharibacillus sp. CPCC 101409]|uniref:ABC transporter ATP-binding protein n=1 Tax=Saccharibacillus sp. CPCC 101409 TaxID=3058041 RepID=UPI0026726BC5|nr:ABC transporter ATP-binding protein [Saccharibacillus sp. CPCC 101409]MDO3410573.1 ABC transporter ATP-binding protein [Saccharibacillus sp. CPCC 101409]
MAISNDICLRASGVGRSFGGRKVLRDISLEVEKAEIFGLLGPSGAGKTTLVKLLAGIDEASAGHVELLGTKLPKLSMLKRIGYMAQSDALYMELSASENLKFFGKLMGLKGEPLKRRMQHVVDLVGLGEHLRKPVSSYSGGMKRRLSLAIALIHEPEVLILDEPTVGIDPVMRQSIWDELREISAGGATIIVTTHVMDEAEKCHRLGMVRDGRLIAVGTPDGLKQDTGSDTIEQAFLYYGGVRS